MRSTAISELNAAVAVATYGNFRRAATALGVSPSALSHAVSSLEQHLGVRLFNRTTRSVSLTQAGQTFLDRVQPALNEIALATESVNEHRDSPRGTLRLNMAEAAAAQILGPLVLAFCERYPDMSVEIVSDDRLVDIVAEGFDAGVRLVDQIPQDMISFPLGGNQRHIVVGAPGYFEGRRFPKTPGDLADHVCIRMRYGNGPTYRWEFSKHGKTRKVEVFGPLLLDNHHLVLAAALGGAGLAYVSEWSARQALSEGSLVQVLSDWTPSYPGLGLYYPQNRYVPAGLRAFVDLVRETRALSGTEANRHTVRKRRSASKRETP